MASKKDMKATWEKAATIRGKNRDTWRRDAEGNKIRRGSYGTRGEYGWEVDHKNPKAKDGSDHGRNLQALHWKANRETGETSIYRRFLGLHTLENRPLNVIEEVKRGLPLSAGETLARHMGVKIKTFLTAYVGMSESTARRRLKSRAGFTVDESDRLVRYTHLLQRATQLMEGDKTGACEWMLTPAPALGGNTPLETADTENRCAPCGGPDPQS